MKCQNAGQFFEFLRCCQCVKLRIQNLYASVLIIRTAGQVYSTQARLAMNSNNSIEKMFIYNINDMTSSAFYNLWYS